MQYMLLMFTGAMTAQFAPDPFVLLVGLLAMAVVTVSAIRRN